MTLSNLPGSIWRHDRQGGLYYVLGVAQEEATLTTVVCYSSLSTGRKWTRPIKEFLDGRFTRMDLEGDILVLTANQLANIVAAIHNLTFASVPSVVGAIGAHVDITRFGIGYCPYHMRVYSKRCPECSDSARLAS